MSNAKFRFTPNARISAVDADTAGNELQRIYDRDGAVVPQVVVDESKPKKAPLHPVFEWSDPIAANLYRCDQARNVIRSVRAVDAEGEIDPTPVYVRVIDEDVSDYRQAADVALVPDLFEKVLEETRRVIAGHMARLRHLSALAGNSPDRAKSAAKAMRAAERFQKEIDSIQLGQ